MRTKPDARKFNLHHLDCRIDGPPALEHGSSSFVVLLEDLELFTQHWFYTSVTYPAQNRHLSLTLSVKHPYAAEYEEDAIPARLQRLMFEPFGRIKDLDNFSIIGSHLKSIEEKVRAEQAEPIPSARHCLEETTKFKDEGNAAFKEGKWEDALRLYVEAFKAMHILIEGRERVVWGDNWFQTYISGGVFDGEFAQQVRIGLRVNLVANIVATYLKMGEYEEAKFHGMRTIELVRQSTGTFGHGDFWSSSICIVTGFWEYELILTVYRTGRRCHDRVPRF